MKTLKELIQQEQEQLVGVFPEIRDELEYIVQTVATTAAKAVGELVKPYRCAACDGAKCGHTQLCEAFAALKAFLGEEGV